MALADEGPERRRGGAWLEEQLESFKEKRGIKEHDPPTEEMIRLQVSLPVWSPKSPNFQELIKKWDSVSKGEEILPSWAQSSIPEEEILEPSPPSQVSRVEMSTGTCMKFWGSSWESEPTPTDGGLDTIDKKEILNANYDDRREVTVYDAGCVIK